MKPSTAVALPTRHATDTPKKLVVLKLLFFFFLIGGLQANYPVFTQKITLLEKNATLFKVFREIRKQTGYQFIYNDEQLSKAKPVSINVRNASIEQVLTICFEHQPVSYTIVEQTIVVVPKQAPGPPGKSEVSALSVQLPPIRISGQVTDDAGKPLEGVSVVFKGSNIGTSTNPSGAFTITIPEKGVLIFTYTGFLTQELAADERLNSLSVTLSPLPSSMNEVVVVGYGTQTKRGVSGSISVVTEKNFNKGVNQTAADLLQGKVPGLVISTESGDVSDVQTMRLRGVSSLTGSSSPFVVIDGVPGMDLTSVAPDDIESISVLKDAAASAIYGSRSASGVILITTKKGRTGQASVQYSGYVAMDRVANKPRVLTAKEWRDYTKQEGIDVTGLEQGADTDWFDEITRTAISHNHNVSITGGSARTNYRASLNYLDRQGTMRDNSLTRYNALVSLNQKALNDRLNLGITVGAVQSDFSPSNPGNISLARNMLPVYPVRNEDGSWFVIRDFALGNPVHNIAENENEFKTGLLYANLKANVDIAKGLQAGVNVFKQRKSSDESLYYSSTSPAGFRTLGFARRGSELWDKQLMEITLQYSRQFLSHNFSVLGGYSYEDNYYKSESAQNRSFITDIFGPDNLSAGENLLPTDVSSLKNMNKLISLFGRINYSFDDKYVVSLSLRRDGSSKFGKSNKWGTFPSASVAWNISDEPFLANSKHINQLKLRVGYGVVGNQDGINPYNSIALYGRGDEYFDNGTWRNTYRYVQNDNPNLKWEQTASLNAGIDYSLVNDRIYGSVDYYIKKTTDMLYTYNVPVPPNLYPTMLANVGDMTNKGIEVLLNTDILRTTDLRWTVTLNFAKNNNVVTRLSNDMYSTESIKTGFFNMRGQGNVTSHIIEEEKQVGTFFGLKSTGLNENGEFTYEDLNKDGEINNDDHTYIGMAIPDFTYGILNTVNYRNWDFTVFFRGVAGNDVLNGPRMQDANRIWLPGTNVLQEALTNGISVAPSYSSYFIEKGSFLRLDNTSLGYTITPRNTNGITKCRFYVSGQNLLLITKFKGDDPEVNMGGLSPGVVELGYVPRARTFSAGISVNF